MDGQTDGQTILGKRPQYVIFMMRMRLTHTPLFSPMQIVGFLMRRLININFVFNLPYFYLQAGDTVDLVSWMTVSSKVVLHGSHSYFLKLTAEKLGAYF